MATTRSYINTTQKQEYLYQTIPDRVQYFAKKCPDKEAFVFISPGCERETITYGQMYERSVHFAKGLLKFGVKQNDIIAVTIPNSAEWLVSTFGILMVGAIPLHAPFIKTDGQEFISLLQSIPQCSLMILDPKHDGKYWKVAQHFIEKVHPDGRIESRILPHLKRIIFTQVPEGLVTTSSLANVSKNGESEPDTELPIIDPDNAAAILTTSGSTGTPKAVIHSHFGLLLGGVHMCETIRMEENDVYFSDRTFSWIGGYPLVTLAVGCTMVTLKQCDLTDFNEMTNFFLDVFEKEKCTVALIIPPVMGVLMKGTHKCQQLPLKCAVAGGMPMPASASAVLGKIAMSLTNLYGCTEVGLVSAFSAEDKTSFTENYIAGYPGSGREIKIVDDNGCIVQRNTLGEIWIRGPGMSIGYQNFPEKFRDSMTPAGWFKTGDMGFIRENGLLIGKGRKSEVIHYGIRNVFPGAMEAEFRKFEGVTDVVVVPIPDEETHEQICACIIRKDGSTLTEDDYKKYFADHMAIDYLWGDTPKYYLFFENFPRTATGKVIRKEVEKIARMRLGEIKEK